MFLYPNAIKIKLMISHDPKVKTKPITDTHNIFLPKPAKLGFPAEIRSITPPIVSIKTAKGAAIIFTIKLKILASIIKKLLIVQSGPLQGTNPWALVKTGIKNNNKNITPTKKSFFI